MSRRARSRALSAAAVVLLAAVSPLAADWLVLKDGSGRVETKGPWQVQGSQVVFHLPNGALSSLRLRDVDLDASQQAAVEAAASKPPATPPVDPTERRAVLTLTDKDVAHVEPTPSPAPAAAAPAVAAPASRIAVSEWHQDFEASAQGVTLVGEITNTSRDVVGEIHVTATLMDDKGELLASGNGLLGTSTLKPGDRTIFRVSIPGVYNYSDVKFETRSAALKTSGGTGG
jgi:hypothetical protein